MTDLLRIAVILLVALNGAAIAGRLPQAVSTMPRDRRTVLTGVGIALGCAIAAALAALHDPILDGLEVERESFRVAAGVVAAVAGAWRMVTPRRRAPGGSSVAAAILPIAFPLTLSPELAALSVSYAADDGVATTLAALAVAGLLTAAVAALLAGRTDAWHEALTAAAARMTGAILIAVGIGLVVDGVRAV